MSISIAVSSASAIPDYSSLKQWIADEVDRDVTDIDDRLNKCIQMAEAHFNRVLRTPEMESSKLLDASAENVALPSDYLAMRSIYVEGSPDRPLRGVSPTAMRQEYDGTSGIPVAYTLVSGGLRLVPPPAAALQLQLDYFAQIERLTDASPSNWLLEKHPDLYVAGALFHYYRWALNLEMAVGAKALRDDLIAEVNKAANNDRYGAGPLIPNTTRQVPGVRS